MMMMMMVVMMIITDDDIMMIVDDNDDDDYHDDDDATTTLACKKFNELKRLVTYMIVTYEIVCQDYNTLERFDDCVDKTVLKSCYD